MRFEPLRWVRERLPGVDGGRGRTVTDGGVAASGVREAAPSEGTGEFDFPDADGDAPEPGATPEDGVEADGEELNIEDDVLIDGMGAPVFILAACGEVVAWNHSMQKLTGTAESTAVGSDRIATAFYPDGRDGTMLADRVLDAPDGADDAAGVELEDPSLPLYAEEEVYVDPEGTERYLTHTAMPLYEGEEFVAVIQTVRDRTEEVRRADDVEDLVDELQGTLQSLTAGQLDARASFDASERAFEDQLLVVVDELNEMAASFETLTGEVDREARTLEGSVGRTADAAAEIATTVDEQSALLAESTDEMQTFSANMEEVAATTDQVATAAEQAREATNEGLEASSDAREATDAVVDIGDDLADSVAELGERMDDIEEVVEVISDVAEQTNLLALNANIEAARAGEAGSGFAVVADEVKDLADETRSHTEKITAEIEELQSQTHDTVEAADESHERIDRAGEQIGEMLSSFEEIADAIDEAADGVAEVSRATDDQAATVEELTATLESVRDHAAETEAATREIVDATDEGSEAVDALTGTVAELRGERSG